MAHFKDSQNLFDDAGSDDSDTDSNNWTTSSDIDTVIAANPSHKEAQEKLKVEEEKAQQKIALDKVVGTVPETVVVAGAEKKEPVPKPVGPPESPTTTRRMRFYRWTMAQVLSQQGYRIPKDQEVCPYWPNHAIRHNKYGDHVLKCGEAYRVQCAKEGKQVVHIRCAYNWKHKVPFQEIDFHHFYCGDKDRQEPDDWRDLKLGKETQNVRANEAYEEYLMDERSCKLRMERLHGPGAEQFLKWL